MKMETETATVDLLMCPKCRLLAEPFVSYQWSSLNCPGHARFTEHFHLTCRRCDYTTAIEAPVQ